MDASRAVPIYGDRWTPLARSIEVRGWDLTGCAMQAQVRLRPDAIGPALATLNVTTDPTVTGLRIVSTGTVDGVPLTLLSFQIAEAAMNAMPAAVENGKDVTIAWDLIVTPPAGVKQVLVGGPFIVRAGVTHA